MNCHLCGRTTATSRLAPSASWCSNTVTMVNSLVAVSVGSVIGGVPPLARCRSRFVAPSNACDADEDIGELEAPRAARSVRRYQPRGLASVEAARRSPATSPAQYPALVRGARDLLRRSFGAACGQASRRGSRGLEDICGARGL